MSRRRITLSSCFCRMLKFLLPCLYNNLWKRAHSVGSCFTRAMICLFAFQHLAHTSYSAPIAPITVCFSLSKLIVQLLFTKKLTLISASLKAPNFILCSFFHKFYLVLGPGLNSIPTLWTLIFGMYTLPFFSKFSFFLTENCLSLKLKGLFFFLITTSCSSTSTVASYWQIFLNLKSRMFFNEKLKAECSIPLRPVSPTF